MFWKKKIAQTPEDVQISQRNAQRLVGDPEIVTAFEEVKNAYAIIWANTQGDEAEKRELAYMNFKAVADVFATLQRRASSAHVRDLKDLAND